MSDPEQTRQQSSAANRVASIIRAQVIEGDLLPGARLPEEQVRSSLSVSRSTLREGFQLLVRERLLVHELSRGFFVRQLTRNDISDLYRVRRMVECAALLETAALLPAHLHGLAKAVEDGTVAAGQEDWARVATASIRFHESIIALADSPRLEVLMSQVLAEFRLSYAYMSDPLRFHSAFLRRNQEIAQFIQTGDLDGAAIALRAYLDDAEKALLEQYDARSVQARRGSGKDSR